MENNVQFKVENPSTEQPTLDTMKLLSLLQKTPIAILEKVLLLCNAIERLEVTRDDNLYIKLKKGLILETNGYSILYSKDYPFMIQVPLLHLNPDFKDNEKKSLDLDKVLKELKKSE